MPGARRRGRDYEAGDLWGSVGAWFSGRWYTEASVSYMGAVRSRMREQTWRRAYFLGG